MILIVKALGIDSINDDDLMNVFNFMDKENAGLIQRIDFILFAATEFDDKDELFRLQKDLLQELRAQSSPSSNTVITDLILQSDPSFR